MTPYYQDATTTIYHGDCREVTEWLSADVLVTDPPYGMRFASGWGGHQGECWVAGDDDTTTRDAAVSMWGDRPALIFGRWSVAPPTGTRAQLTWDKGEHVGMGDLSLPWKPNTEEIYVLGRGFTSPRRDPSVLKFNAVAGTVRTTAVGRWHPTEKPVNLMSHLLTRCPQGWSVADPFMGSGTTLVAAKSLGRRAIGIEVDERYCEIAAKRLAQEVLDFGDGAA